MKATVMLRRMHRIQTPLGGLTLAATDQGLFGAWFDEQSYRPDMDGWVSAADDPVLQRAAHQVGEYFAGARKAFDLPLDLSRGTPFQQQVWRSLVQVPYGSTTSYAVLAAQLGRPRAVRAVGAAIGRNPMCVILPCHRVLGADGSLTGYAGGLDRKRRLLALESGAPVG